MLLALEVPGINYSELSKMVSLTQMHRCPHKHVHCSCIVLQHTLEVAGDFGCKKEKLFDLLFSWMECVCRNCSLTTLSGVCFLHVHITMMSDQEQFNIPIFLTNELYREFAIERRLCIKAGSSAGNYVVSRAKCAAAQHLSVLVSTCSLPPGAP